MKTRPLTRYLRLLPAVMVVMGVLLALKGADLVQSAQAAAAHRTSGKRRGRKMRQERRIDWK